MTVLTFEDQARDMLTIMRGSTFSNRVDSDKKWVRLISAALKLRRDAGREAGLEEAEAAIRNQVCAQVPHDGPSSTHEQGWADACVETLQVLEALKATPQAASRTQSNRDASGDSEPSTDRPPNRHPQD